jgi:hypothetical protein
MKKEKVYIPNSDGIKKYSLSDWNYGQANGFFEPDTGLIHILEGSSVELRSIWHEQAHAARQNKFTFKLARLQNTPVFSNLLFWAIILTTAAKALTNYDFFLITAFILSGVFAVILVCQTYEERQAALTVTQKTKMFKRSGGETV